MNRGEEEENWKREREIGSFKSLSVQMGFIFTALVLYHTFCRKYYPQVLIHSLPTLLQICLTCV